MFHDVQPYYDEVHAATRSRLAAVLEEVEYGLAPLSIPLLITGESGVGKASLAYAVHGWSGREHEFEELRCGDYEGVPPQRLLEELFGGSGGASRRGKLVAIGKTTLLVDDAHLLSVVVLERLLDASEEGRVVSLDGREVGDFEARLVFVTRENSAALEERFGPALVSRLSAGRVELPSLRETPELIPLAWRQAFSARLYAPSPAVAAYRDAIWTSAKGLFQEALVERLRGLRLASNFYDLNQVAERLIAFERRRLVLAEAGRKRLPTMEDVLDHVLRGLPALESDCCTAARAVAAALARGEPLDPELLAASQPLDLEQLEHHLQRWLAEGLLRKRGARYVYRAGTHYVGKTPESLRKIWLDEQGKRTASFKRCARPIANSETPPARP